MRAALTAAELAALRNRPHAVEYYAAVRIPRVVWRGALSDVPTTYPGSAITATNTLEGNINGIAAGQTMFIGSDASARDLGTLRVRRAVSSGSLIPLAEFGSGLVNWKSTAQLTVTDEYRPWPIHHSYNAATSAWLVDLDTYTSQTRQYGPIALVGPPAVVWIEGGKGMASYVGDRSLTQTVGASITSQSWSFPNGQTVTSVLGSSLNPIVITYLNASSGGGVHTLTVTDGNSASHIGQRVTWAFNGSTAVPYRVRFDEITGGLKQGGYTTRIYLNTSGGSAQFPEGTQIVIFEKASYNGVASSIGGNAFGRNHIVMVGWIEADTARIEPFTGELSFAVRTIDAELQRAQAYDIFLESGSAASSWDMASGLTLDRAAIVLTKYRSTIANVTDVNLAQSTASTNEIPYRSLPQGNLWQQLEYNYQANFGIVAADLQSSIYARMDSQLIGASAGLPNLGNISAADLRDAVVIEHPHNDENSQTVVYAVQGGGSNIALGAISPGDRIGYRGTRQEISRNVTVPNQDTAILWAGHWRAALNNPYKRITIPFSGNYRIDSVPQSRFTLSLSPTNFQNVRQINWNNKSVIPYETRIVYDPFSGYVNTEVVAETVVDGIGGSSITFPRAITPVNTNPAPVPPPTTGGGGASGGLVYVVTRNRIGRTRNFNATNPNWVNVMGNINLDPGEIILDFILDPYNPQNIAYCLTSTHIYRTASLDQSPPTWTLKATYSDFGFAGGGFRRIQATIARNERVFATATDDATWGYLHLLSSNDSGTTWTDHGNSGGSKENMGHYGLAVGQHDADRAWLCASYNTSPAIIQCNIDAPVVYTNIGASDGNQGRMLGIYCPYADNPYDDDVWVEGHDAEGVVPELLPIYRYVNGGFTQSGLSEPSGHGSPNPYGTRLTVDTNTAQRVYAFIYAELTNHTCFLYRSDDGGVNWTNVRTTSTLAQALGLWTYDGSQGYYLDNAQINFFTDNGNTLYSKTGDWSSATMGYNWGEAGTEGRMIVPVWTV